MQTTISKLDRRVDIARDHILGPVDAAITLVEYGSYDCMHCRTANARITEVRNRFGERLRYAFRHRPIPGSDIARRAAELVERIDDPVRFWEAHVALMSRSTRLNEDDLRAVAADFGVDETDVEGKRRARGRVDEDEGSAGASGVMVTPTFFINGRRYDGPWDESALSDALLNSLGHRVRTAALEFASWAPSAGVLLLLASVLAVILTNSTLGEAFITWWELPFGVTFGDVSFRMSLHHWINDGLLTLFFLVVGLEIKREFTVGHLAGRRSAALPVAAAVGGMAVPALLYVLIIPAGPWFNGWGVPMATDTAFAIALIAMMGRRVPVELRIFLTAAAIVDDIGAIGVVAVFYSTDLKPDYLLAAAAIAACLAWLNYVRVYRASPYLLLGVLLWACVYAGGVHATLAGVILAMFIPTRPPPNYRALTAQADAILSAEAAHGGEVLRLGPSEPALRALDAIHDRIESPADRMLRHFGPRSSYVVLPLFALANAGVVMSADALESRQPLMFAIFAGLAVGKPLGMVSVSALAVWLGLAVKPREYSWQQLAGAGALAGIGFTMSLFIASQAFPVAADFAATKIAVFAASIFSVIIGTALLLHAARNRSHGDETPG
ncbi:MAG TPA: Na+/H+ antiporter NhaA [Gammaproteobacteria bacterium]